MLVPLALATGVDWRVLLLLLLTARQSTAAAVLPAVDWQQQQTSLADNKSCKATIKKLKSKNLKNPTKSEKK